MTKVKICGLSRRGDAAIVNAALPDAAGFIFAKKSRRYIAPEDALVLRGLIDPRITTVGVLVDAPLEEAAAIAQSGAVGVLQLHGHEDDAYIAALRGLTDLPIVQAFRVENAADLENAARSAAGLILLDHGSGGTGEAFDWSLLKGFERPYVLAGGLDPGNVARAVAELSPYAVDVSSGVETGGVKDAAKAALFVKEARRGGR